MGLDITAFRKLKPAPDAKIDGDGYPEDSDAHYNIRRELAEFTEKEFPGRTRGLVVGVCTFGEYHAFPAGSYGGYNEWRDHLAQMAHGITAKDIWDLPPRPDFAFRELIDFSDCEGIIGPEVAAKLAKDFADNAAKAAAYTAKLGDGWFYGRYVDWQKAFEMAADGGAVVFH